MKENVAGIVLYNPDMDRLKKNIDAILEQVDHLLLVDNNSDNYTQIESEYNLNKNISFIKNKKNMGVSKAFNQIIYFFEERKQEWVLILDQDSIVPNNMIKNYSKYLYLNNIGIITLRIINENYFKKESTLINDIECEYIDKCISSGSYLNIPICKKIGYFDEKMFIDLVDFEYCIRIQKAGFKILRLNNVVLNHQLGELRIYHFFEKKIFVTNHSSTRCYYYARNCIYYLKKHRDYFSKKKKFMIHFKLLSKIIKIIVFEKKKILKLKAVIRGIRDVKFII